MVPKAKDPMTQLKERTAATAVLNSEKGWRLAPA